MRRIAYLLSILMIAASALLIAYSPDMLSMIISGIMLAVITAGVLFGILPALSYTGALKRAISSVESTSAIQADSLWQIANGMSGMFRQKDLDRLYEQYREKLEMEQDAGQTLGDVENYINEDSLALLCWNGAVVQIPGTMTGLGILGTFVGLIIGINGIGFSSVETALTSVETLLAGIRVAFYTSIAGVILSIFFNLIHRTTWNLLRRQLALFLDRYHKMVIPPVEEQERYLSQGAMKQIIERLDRIPKAPGFSIAGVTNPALSSRNEQILLPQVIEGIENHEFTFLLQPKFDINTRRIVGAEACVRWNHPKLGMLSPAVFLPVLELDGYVVKLDEYIWENVISVTSKWLMNGIKTPPIAVNVSKTDILAGDVVSFFDEKVKEYQIASKNIVIEIAYNAFTEIPDIASRTAKELRNRGFGVILDQFNGDFVTIGNIDTESIDEIKCDLRLAQTQETKSYISSVFGQAKQFSYNLSAYGIESMDQVSVLRKAGCVIGQGLYFSNMLSHSEFLKALKKAQKE